VNDETAVASACRVLIAEDDEELRDSLVEVLELRDYNVVVVGLGAAAEAACRDQQFDIGIMDITLPDGSGLERVPVIETLQTDIEILIVTGNAETDLAKAVRPSTIGFLQKPVDMNQLLSTISAVAERRELARKNREFELTW
jgi:two-component system cell cycle response regulator